MSDPVTNVEIEDVLSSIRRLVSVQDRDETPVEKADAPQDVEDLTDGEQPPLDLGEVAKEITPSPEDEPESPALDRLVLTAALRVDDAPVVEETKEDPAEGAETTAQAEGDDSQADQFDVADTAGDDNAWADDQGQFEGDDVAEQWQETDQHADEHSPDLDAAEFEPEDAAAEPTPEGDTDQAFEDPVFDVPQDTLAARVAELQAVVAAQDEEWEADGGEDADHGTVVEMPWEAHMPPEDDTDLSFDTPEEAPMADMAEETDYLDVVEFAHIEDAELVEDENQDDTVHAAAVTDDLAADAPQSEPEPYDAQDDDEAADLMDDADGAILDEEALRDLVAEIVRQELQGSLGERITRNVRKLVRREIHRALASQELD